MGQALRISRLGRVALPPLGAPTARPVSSPFKLQPHRSSLKGFQLGGHILSMIPIEIIPNPLAPLALERGHATLPNLNYRRLF